MFVLNTQYVTYVVTSLVAVCEAAIRVKINVYGKIVIENRKKRENMEINEIFFLHISSSKMV